MELGEKLKAARLEAGLSQRQLCGDVITRNMLSQIENGSAKPSYATLQALCARLGKPVSYFWAEAPSENLQLLHTAQAQPPQAALLTLQGYLSPDPLLDTWYQALKCQVLLALVQQAIDEEKTGYAAALLQQAEPILPPEQQRQYLLLQYALQPEAAPQLVKALPDNTSEQLLRAEAALRSENPQKCIAFLDCCDRQPEAWHFLRAEALMALHRYEEAISILLPLEETRPAAVFPRLELCYKELGNFEKAYFYAAKQLRANSR